MLKVVEKMVDEQQEILDKGSESTLQSRLAMDLEDKLKFLNEREISIKGDEKNLELLREEVDKAIDEINEKERRIAEEMNKLRDEKAEHVRQQTEFEDDKERYKVQSDLLSSEFEVLKRDKHRFEEVWETLDEKSAILDRERDIFDKEVEGLSLEKDLFAAEHDQLVREGARISLQREEVADEMARLVKEKQELVDSQLGVRKEIDELGVLTKKLRDQREDLIYQRSRFFSFIEKLKNCQHRRGVLKTVSNYALEVNRSLITTDGKASWLRKCTSNIFRFSSRGNQQQQRLTDLADEEVVLEDNIEAVVDDAVAYLGDTLGVSLRNAGSDGESRKRTRAMKEPAADDTESSILKRHKVGKDAAADAPQVSEASVNLSEQAETGGVDSGPDFGPFLETAVDKFRTVKDDDFDANEIQDDGDDEDDDDEAGEKSVGRKLWKFIIT